MLYYDIDGNEVEVPVDETAAKILAKMESSDDSNAVKLGGLLADPDVQKIMEAKERGEEFSITVGSLNKSDEDNNTDTNYDDMSNEDLAGKITKDIMGGIGNEIKKQLEPVTGSLDTLNNRAKDDNAIAVQNEYGRLKGIYPDIDKYKTNLITICDNNPNLTMEQSLLIASGGETKKVDLSSERPTSTTPPTRTARTDRTVPLARGRKGMQTLLAESKGVDIAVAQNEVER